MEAPTYLPDTKVHPMDVLHNKHIGLLLDADDLFFSYWKEIHLETQSFYLYDFLPQFPDTLSNKRMHLLSCVEVALHNEFFPDFLILRLRNQYHMLFSLQHPILSVLSQHDH